MQKVSKIAILLGKLLLVYNWLARLSEELRWQCYGMEGMMIAWFPWNCFITKNKMSFNFSANWIMLILVLTILEQTFRSRFKVALEFLLRFGKIGLQKLCHTPPGFITVHYYNADKEALSLKRLSSYKFILLSKRM